MACSLRCGRGVQVFPHRDIYSAESQPPRGQSAPRIRPSSFIVVLAVQPMERRGQMQRGLSSDPMAW